MNALKDKGNSTELYYHSLESYDSSSAFPSSERYYYLYSARENSPVNEQRVEGGREIEI